MCDASAKKLADEKGHASHALSWTLFSGSFQRGILETDPKYVYILCITHIASYSHISIIHIYI